MIIVTDAELLKLVVLNLPNFIFAAVCVGIQHKQNMKMMEMLEKKCFEDCEKQERKGD